MPHPSLHRRHFNGWLLGLAASAGLPARAASPWVDEDWRDTARARELPVRLRWPAGDGPCGLVFFSHGLGGSRNGGAVWGEAWQEAGFLVVHLQHPGSDIGVWAGGMRSLREATKPEQYLARVADARFALDEVERRVAAGGRWARVRRDAIGFSGHSFGARLTQALAGESPVAGRFAPLSDSRPRAFIAFSPGFGTRAEDLDAEARRRFAGVDRPFLCITGSQDGAVIVGDATQESRRAVYRGLPTANKAELVLQGADHMTFGGQVEEVRAGLVGRVLQRAPGAAQAQARHHEIVARVSADWWRWRLLGDTEAGTRLAAPAGLDAADLWQRS